MNTFALSKNLQTLTNHDLLARARELAHEERRAGVALLHHLREIDRRKLFAANHGSLHEYVVRELGYSDGAAHRRISAMRLMSTVPEIEDRLRSGALTLSSVSQVQNFLRAEKKLTGTAASTTEVRQLVSQIEGKSTRETEALLAARAPEVAQHLSARRLERPRAIGTDHSVQVTLTLHRDLQLKLQRLRDRTAHRDPNPSLAAQIEWLADFVLARLTGARTAKKGDSKIVVECSPKEAANDSGAEAHANHSGAEAHSNHSGAEAHSNHSGAEAHSNHSGAEAHAQRSRHIPAAIRRQVWSRAGGRCEHRFETSSSGDLNGSSTDATNATSMGTSTGRCTRTHLLQVDHRIPFSWGGGHEIENLQLLCAVHNARKSDRLPSERKAPARVPQSRSSHA